MSVAIVCRNNEPTIGRTLESVKGLADEIVAVDSGSTDGTIAMLEAAGARVIRSEWLGHIRTKQKALEACTCEWILCIDSDESVEPDLAVAIRGALEDGPADPSPSGYELNRRIYYRGRPLRHAWQPEWRVRLVRRGKAGWGGHDPHDVLSVTDGGALVRMHGVLRHDSFPTFAEHLRKQWQHSATMASSLHAAGRRGSYFRLAVSPAGAFVKQLILKRGFLDGYAGWLAAASTAAGALMKHAMLLELSRGGVVGGGESR
ncbi:MAG: glycosyltransferase family 2 protein [Phycisphaerales bacterium]|nr:glycosyltransferase family 2 protein [Phycisphaerales bacterium]